jgi:rfaE bifunctional protein nucleotidyltransferase chain/domain
VEEVCAQIRAAGQSIATINGSFDLLHAGHLHILFEASKQADVLIVALNSDDSIRRYKSPQRPIVTLEYRLEMMAALGFVDFVTWFEDTDPLQIIRRIKPDVHCNGAEYGSTCIEAGTVRDVGARLHIIDLVPGLSTSSLIERIQDLCD